MVPCRHLPRNVMQSVILSQKMPAGYGGRPMHLGHLVHEENVSGFGIFVGYDHQGHKVAVRPDDLEKCLESIGAVYKIHVSAEKVSVPFNWSKIFFHLVPQGLKKEIIKQGNLIP